MTIMPHLMRQQHQHVRRYTTKLRENVDKIRDAGRIVQSATSIKSYVVAAHHSGSEAAQSSGAYAIPLPLLSPLPLSDAVTRERFRVVISVVMGRSVTVTELERKSMPQPLYKEDSYHICLAISSLVSSHILIIFSADSCSLRSTNASAFPPFSRISNGVLHAERILVSLAAANSPRISSARFSVAETQRIPDKGASFADGVYVSVTGRLLIPAVHERVFDANSCRDALSARRVARNEALPGKKDSERSVDIVIRADTVTVPGEDDAAVLDLWDCAEEDVPTVVVGTLRKRMKCIVAPAGPRHPATMAPELPSQIHEHHLQECLRALQETRAFCLEILRQDRERSLNGAPPAPIDRSKSQKQLLASLSRLRSLHRNAYMVLRQTKQTTSEARQEQDRLNLQLQNLYYQQRHLRGEIDACLDFPYEHDSRIVLSHGSFNIKWQNDANGTRHTYKDIPLVPEEDYLQRHPEDADKDPHELMKQRLYDERAVREELETKRKQLIAKKQALIAENKRRKDDLASLDEHLKKFIESSKPIQETFKKEY
ncbi:LOW QUALITY PROTEIN: hypothetical protein Dda_3296 [Drechslerella dactyloides]|uniref:Uncharacterized protein n=1 Tax=Drechslerella dactyloides TaxID=74499 RepID=A0AAD6J5H1_DREDA|nr:LOW QUALITY PROTEIN: hypothetical protein Dda_3296 [Drechslerella dactyloides]